MIWIDMIYFEYIYIYILYYIIYIILYLMDLCQDSKPVFDWFESDWNWRGLVACGATGEDGPFGKFGVAKRHQMDADKKITARWQYHNTQ